MLSFDSNTSTRTIDTTWSYLTLRLLKEVNGRVAFFPPNGHLTGKTAERKEGEPDSKLADALDKWTCISNEFQTCILECVEHLAGNLYHVGESFLEFNCFV